MNLAISSGLFALVLALISGVAMAVQGGMNSGLGKIIGLLEATFIVHLTAAVLVGVMLFVFSMGEGSFSRLTEIPWYLWLGGAIGVVITYFVVASISKVGAAAATTAIIVGQVTTAMLLDHFGIFGLEKVAMSWIKFLGLGLLAVGARLMLLR